MRKEFKDLWVKCLRDNNDKQCFGRNIDIDEYGVIKHCAIGVLQEYSNYYDIISDMSTKSIYDGVCVPRLMYKGKLLPIVTLNDEYRLSFNELADLIDEQY